MVEGKLEKMLILAYESAEKAESGGVPEAKAKFEALINPETYTIEYKIKTSDSQGQGSSGTQVKFQYAMPDELTFDFLFDNTGLIDGKPEPDGIFEKVNAFKLLLTEYHGESHEPYHLKLVWGNLLFKGRAIEVGITYKLFNPDGQPIRAVVRVKFKGSIEEKKRVAQEFNQSPDLTHRRTVKPGDTLPFMCFQVYGDPRHYVFVAAFNDLADFRSLRVGDAILFPPLRPVKAPSR